MKTKTELFLDERQPQLRCSTSIGNRKMGDIPSFSFPPVSSYYMKERICTTCGCNGKTKGCGGCYAKTHVYNRFKQTAACYEDNYYTYKTQPDLIWRGIEASLMMNKTFRFFVSGDIPDYQFFEKEMELIMKYPECQILQFTKKFDIVNEWIEKNGELPSNLHMLFSAWKGLQMSNPFLLPECHLIYTDGSTTASEDKVARYCSGNCTECFIEKKNCFVASKNEQILIKAH